MNKIDLFFDFFCWFCRNFENLENKLLSQELDQEKKKGSGRARESTQCASPTAQLTRPDRPFPPSLSLPFFIFLTGFVRTPSSPSQDAAQVQTCSPISSQPSHLHLVCHARELQLPHPLYFFFFILTNPDPQKPEATNRARNRAARDLSPFHLPHSRSLLFLSLEHLSHHHHRH